MYRKFGKHFLSIIGEKVITFKLLNLHFNHNYGIHFQTIYYKSS